MERISEEVLRLNLLKRGLDLADTRAHENVLPKRLKVEGHEAMERLKMLAQLKRKDLGAVEGATETSLQSYAAAATAYEEKLNGSLRGATVSHLLTGLDGKENVSDGPVDMSSRRR